MILVDYKGCQIRGRDSGEIGEIIAHTKGGELIRVRWPDGREVEYVMNTSFKTHMEVLSREPLFVNFGQRRLPASVPNPHPHPGGCWFQRPVIHEGEKINVEFFDGVWSLSATPAGVPGQAMNQGHVRIGRPLRQSSEVLARILRALGFDPTKPPKV